MTDEQRAELLALAEHCEAATGPDRELDRYLFAVLHGVERQRVTGPMDFPATASIDAALTLVPEGRAAMVLRQAIDACLTAVAHRSADFTRRLPVFICAAALRARAAA